MKIEKTEDAIKRLNDIIRVLYRAKNYELADNLDDIRQFIGRKE